MELDPKFESPISYNPEDEHVQILINKNLRLCQGTMRVEIKDADKKAQRVHERADCLEERLVALDHEKVGMVTIMWNERQKISDQVRNFFIGTLLLVLTAMTVQYLGTRNTARPDLEQVMRMVAKDAAKEALKEVVKNSIP